MIVAPFAEKLVGAASEALASGAVAGVAVGTAPASGAFPRNSGGACVSAGPETGPPLSPPDSIARSVCATRAASAFLRYTMNMLPPARPGVSNCSMSCRTRARRPGLSARTSTLFERGSAMIITRCWASIGPAPAAPGSASSRFSNVTMSSADALRSGTRIGSAPGAWSSDAMIRSIRLTLSA